MVVKAPKTTNEGVRVPMVLAKETKGTYVYNAKAEDAAVTVLYVRKTGFQGDPPENVVVTIEAV